MDLATNGPGPTAPLGPDPHGPGPLSSWVPLVPGAVGPVPKLDPFPDWESCNRRPILYASGKLFEVVLSGCYDIYDWLANSVV